MRTELFGPLFQSGLRVRLMGRRSSRISYIPLAAILIAASGYSQTLTKPVPRQQEAHRVLVKIRPALAQQIEAELPTRGPAEAMAIQSGQATGAGVQGFMGRYSARSLTPLYPDIIRLRQQQGWSDIDVANHLRQQFPRRTARQAQSLATPEISRTYVLEFPGASASQINALAQRLKSDPDVEFAEPDQIVTTSQLPNDPFLSSSGTWGQSYQDLWGHYKINAPAAWDENFFGDGVIVAVVDTGIDYNHVDIAANVIKGLDFIGADCTNPVQGTNPIDHFGHGTHVAGTIAALGNNGIGIIGVAWHAQVMAVKGLDDFGCGLESTLAPAITYAVNNGADVINASWGGQGSSQTIEEAVQFAYGLGVVFVAAAGNSNEDALNFFPANSPEAVTVAASDAFDNFAFFSNFGSKIDVTAPGVDILSLRAADSQIGLLVGADYMRLDGTSMATPHVAGTAALILSQHPAYSPEDVRQAIRASAANTAGWDPQFGYGIVNAQAALALAGVLDAHIASPLGGTPVTSVTTISGVAQGANFDHYVLEFGAGIAPTSWTQLQTGTSPVSGGTLGTFDPGTVPDGIYTIRLTVFDAASHAFSDRVELVVDFLAISSPARPAVPSTASEFKPGVLLSITGKATGATFKDFRLQWAKGIFPSSGWSSSGITLTGVGKDPVNSGAVGTWDTTSITTADYYTLRLLVDNATFTSEADTLIYLEPDLLSANWPQALDQAPDFQSGFTPVTDAAGNTLLSLSNPRYLFSLLPPQLKKFTPQGVLQSATQLNSGGVTNPAAGEMEGRPGQETIVPDGNSILLIRPDNTSFTFTPSPPFDSTNFFDSQIVLAELEGNSELDVLALGTQYPLQTAHLFAWRRDGSLLNSAFPVSIPDQNLNLTFFSLTPRVLAGDIKGDGLKELVVVEGPSPSTFTLKLFAPDGTPLPWSFPVLDGVPLSIVLADLDHNGKLETLVVVASSDFQVALHVFQPDGTERAGWPQMLDGFGFNMVVGDLDHSGKEEIIVPGLFLLYVFNPDGTSFSNSWPRPGNQLGHVALADIDGDGFPEILVVQNGFLATPNPRLPNGVGSAGGGNAPARAMTIETQFDSSGRIARSVSMNPKTSAAGQTFYLAPSLLALHRDGAQVKLWNLLGTSGNQPFFDGEITVGDFNHDGTTDIALSYFTVFGGGTGGFLLQGTATVLSMGAPFHPAVNDWPMIFRDPRNNPVLRRDLTPPTISMTSPANGSQVGGTVTLAATATDDIGVTGVQFQVDGVNLGMPVTIAPFTATWDSTAVANGPHMLTAVAIDAAGHSTVSLPLTVSVISPDFSVAASPASANIKAGSSATFSFTITPVNGFNATVTFFCSGLPAESQCSFAPPSVTPNGAPATTTLTITTTASSVSLLAPPVPRNNLPLYASLSGGVLGLLWMVCSSKRRRTANMGLLLGMIALFALAGCGGGSTPGHHDSGTPLGTSQITVLTSAGSKSKTVPITLTVQ